LRERNTIPGQIINELGEAGVTILRAARWPGLVSDIGHLTGLLQVA